jgi:uncharacterized protein
MTTSDSASAIADTQRWLERAVIGLNLCPFAKAVQAKGQVHFASCDDDSFAGVLDALGREADVLVAMDTTERDTTLLVLPRGFDDFLLFNDLVHEGVRLLSRRGLDGVLQLASFHPRFHFADSTEDDPGNNSNRAPHPTLHLLREASIDRAVEAFPDAEAIFGANIGKLRALGAEGWAALDVGASP